MPTLSPIEKTRLDQLVDKIVNETATITDKLEVAFWSKKYTNNLNR
jgi:hypothetical protein